MGGRKNDKIDLEVRGAHGDQEGEDQSGAVPWPPGCATSPRGRIVAQHTPPVIHARGRTQRATVGPCPRTWRRLHGAKNFAASWARTRARGTRASARAVVRQRSHPHAVVSGLVVVHRQARRLRCLVHGRLIRVDLLVQRGGLAVHQKKTMRGTPGIVSGWCRLCLTAMARCSRTARFTA